MYPIVLKYCRDIHQHHILIFQAGNSPPSIFSMMIMMKNLVRGATFKDTYYAGATQPVGRYTGK
jgi:hypothetical protein